MASRLSDARRSLQRAKEASLSRLRQLDEERREIKASLKSLDAAIKALGDPKREADASKPSSPLDTPSSDSPVS